MRLGMRGMTFSSFAISAFATFAAAAALTGRLEIFLLANPDLDADLAGGRVRLGETVVDVRAERVERDLALLRPLDARDFGAVDAAGGMDLDSVHAHVHRDLLGALHRPLEGDAALELLRDRLGHELGVRVGIMDFLDVEIDFLARHVGEVLADLVDVLALAADDHARTGAEERDAHAVGVALDQDLRDAGALEALLHVLADLLVLGEEGSEGFLGREPAAAPRVVDADAEPDRVNFLSR